MTNGKTYLVMLISMFGMAFFCLADTVTTESSIIMKRQQVLDLGGHEIKVSNLYGSGVVTNGIIMSTNIVVLGSLTMPAYNDMVIRFADKLIEDNPTLLLTGSATNVFLDAENLTTPLRIRFPTNSIYRVVLSAPTGKNLLIKKKFDGWDIRHYPLVMKLR